MHKCFVCVCVLPICLCEKILSMLVTVEEYPTQQEIIKNKITTENKGACIKGTKQVKYLKKEIWSV